MKKLLLIFTIVWIIAFIQVSLAQQPQKSPEQKADGQTNKWTRALRLSQDQAVQTRAIFLQKEQQINNIKANYANSPNQQGMHAEEKAVHNQMESALQQVFTPQQYSNYLAIKEQEKQQRQQNQQQNQQYQQPNQQYQQQNQQYQQPNQQYQQQNQQYQQPNQQSQQQNQQYQQPNQQYQQPQP
jgi:hypothetical protein